MSCPGDPVINDFPTLLQELPVMKDSNGDAMALEWDPINQKYMITYDFEFGKGYFIYAYAPCQVNVEYQPQSALTCPVNPVWNLVGSVAESVPLCEVTCTPAGSVGDIILGWDAINQEFLWKDKNIYPDYGLDPGSAHFIYTYEPGFEVILDCSEVGQTQQAQIAIKPAAEPIWERAITIETMDKEHKQELVFGIASSASSGLDISYDIPIPPYPTTGNDDALIKAGWIVEGNDSLLLRSSFLDNINVIRWDLSVELSERGLLFWPDLPGGYKFLLIYENRFIEIKEDGNIPLKAGTHHLILNASRFPPARTSALVNYPNPFNPETWIPYQLSVDTEVNIKIYNSTGQLIRTLSLGHKIAGFYTDRLNAAYWDGRNESGENVSSGVYFYAIQAGDEYTATKKMVIAR
jgi:hypothetical protein